MRRYGHHRLHGKQGGLKGMVGKLSIAVVVLLICTPSLLFSANISGGRRSSSPSETNVEELWGSAKSGGWRTSSAPRSDWPSPPRESNGYLRVRCNGGLNQQRSAICNAVLAARIMNATLVLPELDANSFWHDDSGFQGIYDVEHFIQTLRYDVQIVESIPEIHKNGKIKKIKAYQMEKHGAIYLTPFSYRLAEEIDNPKYQRLRCRVNYHALRFKPNIVKLRESIVDKLRARGHFRPIHLRFEMDMLAFAGCFDIFTPEQQRILKKYREENFKEKKLVYKERRAIGKCPLTPEEVSLVLRAVGFDNSTRIYLAAGELFGGERFMKPFWELFPHLENHSSVDPSEELLTNTRGLLGSAITWFASSLTFLCQHMMDQVTLPTIFWVTDSTMASGLQSDLTGKVLPLFSLIERMGKQPDLRKLFTVRCVMLETNFGGPHKRVSHESFYTNSWPECFCQISTQNPADECPPDNVLEILNSRLESEAMSDLKSLNQGNLSTSVAER